MRRVFLILGVLLCTNLLMGQVVYRDIEPNAVVITQDEMGYPLNILESINTSTEPQFYVQNYWFEDSPAASYFAVFGDGAGVVVEPSSVFSAGLVKVLSAGTTIGSNSSWSVEMFPVLHDSELFTDWVGTIGYVGVKAKAGNNTYYGWVKLQIETNKTFVIYEYAIETTPGKAIVAGDKGNVSIRSVEFDNLEAYPNPTDGRLTIVNTEAAESISIVDMMGREVMRLNPIMGEQNVNISSLESGNYLLTIKTDKGLKVKKIVLR